MDIIEKIRLYLLNIKEILEEPLGELIYFFSEESQVRIKKYRFVSDQNRTAWAEILLRFLLPDDCRKLAIKRTVSGKPYFSGSEYQFNLSHSGEWIACTLGRTASGVDIQQEEEVFLSVAEKYFLPEEYREICVLDKTGQRNLFYKLWCIKESYLKYQGTGLAGGLRSVNCRELLTRKKSVGCCTFFLPPGYHLSVTASISSLPFDFSTVNLAELRSFAEAMS